MRKKTYMTHDTWYMIHAAAAAADDDDDILQFLRINPMIFTAPQRTTDFVQPKPGSNHFHR